MQHHSRIHEHAVHHTPRQATDLAVIREKNQAAQQRTNAIAFVMEHLDVFAVTVAMGRSVKNDDLRHMAERIVDGLFANARLIAAAPDLLAALKHLLRYDFGDSDGAKEARAAIAKAEAH